MAGFRLSTDILSPIHSDISLNDVSQFSFGSLPNTPDCDKETKLFGNKHKKDFDPFDTSIKEAASELDKIINDFDKASNINARKGKKHKESYDNLKQQMGELPLKKAYCSSIFSPISQEIKSSTQLESLDAKINSAKLTKNSQNVKLTKRNKISECETLKVSNKKDKNTKNECFGSVKESKSHNETKSTCSSKVSVIKKRAHSDNDTKPSNVHRKSKASAVVTCNKPNKTVELKQLPSNTKSNENNAAKPKEQKTVKDFKFKSQQKICIAEPSNPITKNKGLSVEKAVQVAIGLQLDNFRSFILDQNLNMRKDLIKLQESAKEQAEVTGYLFSVIDELFETNKKLCSKHN